MPERKPNKYKPSLRDREVDALQNAQLKATFWWQEIMGTVQAPPASSSLYRKLKDKCVSKIGKNS